MVSADAALGWLRRNLVFGMTLASLLSAGVGGLVTATLRVARYDFRIDSDERARIQLADQVEKLNKDHDADAKEAASQRAKLAADLAMLNQRLVLAEETPAKVDEIGKRVGGVDDRLNGVTGRTALLEGQIGFIADFVRAEIALNKGKH